MCLSLVVQYIKKWLCLGSSVVEHTTHYLKAEGLNPATCIGRDKMATNIRTNNTSCDDNQNAKLKRTAKLYIKM